MNSSQRESVQRSKQSVLTILRQEEFEMPTIRIAVSDDHAMFRERDAISPAPMILGSWLRAPPLDALKVAAELRPDLMLLDLGLPGGRLEAAAAGIFQACAPSRFAPPKASSTCRDA